MIAGQMDQRITLQSLTEINEFGALSQSWSDVASVAARVVSQKGGEAFEAARVNARETIRVMIRYRGDVKTSWRAVWQTQSYNIIHIDRSQRRDGVLWFTAEAVGA